MKETKPTAKYVVCVRNESCEDLVLRKIYEVLPDDTAEHEGYLRVTDESGEDYLYPMDFFLPVELPRKVERALATTV